MCTRYSLRRLKMEVNDTDKADEKASGSQNLPVQSEEKESSLYWQLGQKLGACMLHLYTSKMWTDVTFRCKDHVEDDKADIIHAHKIVLAARSPFFQGMFFGSCVENREAEFDLLTTDAEIFDLVMRYIYSDETNLTEDTAVRVLELAHMYQLPNLVKYCADFLSSVLRSDNACEMLELALLYNQTKLRDAACAYIDNHVKLVLDSDGFHRISNDCLTYILKGNTLFHDEIYIFKRVMYWAECKLSSTGKTINGQSKRNVLGEAFFHLRLPTLSTLDFVRCIKDHDLYTMKEMLNIIEYMNDKSSHERLYHIVLTRVQEKIVKHIFGVYLSTAWMEHGTSPSPSLFGCERNLVKSHSQAIDCTVLVTASNDCYIRGLSLQKINPYLPVKSNKCVTYNKDSLIDITLDCVLCLDEIKYKTAFQIKPNESKPIVFENPVFLGKKDTPYTLKLAMKYRSENSPIYLEAGTKSAPVADISTCKDTNHTTTCLKEHRGYRDTCDLKVSYCYCSKHFNCIYNLLVHHISDRNSDS